jgi:penicillin V acylase-like amidase (Ntn superfamily)
MQRVETIELRDVMQAEQPFKIRLKTWAEEEPDDGIVVEDESGTKVVIENYNGKLTVHLWQEQNQDPYTLDLDVSGIKSS